MKKDELGDVFEAFSASIRGVEDAVAPLAREVEGLKDSVDGLSSEIGALSGLLRNYIEAQNERLTRDEMRLRALEMRHG